MHHQDQVALGYLEDVWLNRDPKEKRCFILEFVRCLWSLSQLQLRTSYVVLQYFRENPFFHDTVLKKEYRYSPSTDVDGERKDEWGITDAQAAFSWDKNVEPLVLECVPANYHELFTFLRFVGHQNQLEGRRPQFDQSAPPNLGRGRAFRGWELL